MPAVPSTPSTGARLLVVDDEPSILDVLATSLRFAGYDVRTAATGRDALECVRTWGPDLMLLDVMLPDLDGFDVIRRLRTGVAKDTRVIFLTAREDTIVDGLELGADDYVTKPFRLEEVAARVGAVLRRGSGPATPAERVLTCADLEMDLETWEVRRAGVPIELSPTEFRLLRHLLSNAGRVVTRTRLLEEVWDHAGADDSVLKTYVSYLRRKLDAHGPALIHTRRGIGYTLGPPA